MNKKTDNLEIEELVKEYYKTGDESIKSIIIDKFRVIIKNCCSKLYLICGETDDLIQEGNIGLLKAFESYNPEKNDKFIPFAIMCIKGAQINAVKKEMKEKIKDESKDEDEAEPENKKDKFIPRAISLDNEVEKGAEDMLLANTLSPEDIVVGNIRAVEIFKHIEKSLSKKENEVLFYHFEGLQQKEIAEVLGESAKDVGNTLYRIRSKVTKIVEEGKVD